LENNAHAALKNARVKNFTARDQKKNAPAREINARDPLDNARVLQNPCACL
jgi:hypothetical protein